MPKKPRTRAKKAAANFIGPLPQGVKRKARKTKRAGPMVMGKKSGVTKMAHVHHACSILDPFCGAARAAKRPDGMGQQSLGFCVRGSRVISTDANGNAMSAFVPGLGRYGIATAVPSGGPPITTYTLPAAWETTSSSGFVATNAGEVRIVSFGAIIRNIAAMTECKGLLHLFSLANPVVSQVFSVLNQNMPESRTAVMTSGQEVSWISKPLGASAHTFRPFAQATTTMSDFDWSSLFVEVYGGPASAAVLMVEYVINVELTLNSAGLTTTALGGTITKQRPANPVATQVQGAVHSKLDSFVDGGIKALENTVKNAASSALDAMESFGLDLLFTL